MAESSSLGGDDEHDRQQLLGGVATNAVDGIVTPDADGAWALYADTRDRLLALVRPLSAEEAARPVPLTSGWTIAAVAAHVCGLNADVAAGMREGLGTDERTAHQVAIRAGRSVDEVCDEWLGHAPAMERAIGDDPFFGRRLAADLVVHLHDVEHALGRSVDPDDEATRSGARTYAARTPDRLAAVAHIAVTIELSDGSRFAPTDQRFGPEALILRAAPYDFLRSVTGRRSRRQVAALDWSGDPTAVLDHLCPYGPLRSTDAEI